MTEYGNKETAEYLRCGQDVCANCGKYYDQHLLWDGNKCEMGSINGWFPKRLADAIRNEGNHDSFSCRRENCPACSNETSIEGVV